MNPNEGRDAYPNLYGADRRERERFAAALAETAPVPAGYRLDVSVQRKFAHRNLWNVRVYRGTENVWGRAYYNLPAGIVQAQAVAWSMAGDAA